MSRMGKDHKKKKSHKEDKERRKEVKKRKLDELKQRKIEEKERKRRLKETETPEERNARRLAKKRMKSEKAEKEKEIYGYTNDNNPFGDANLTKPFLWRHKHLKDAKEGKKVGQLTKQQLREKQMELRQEIEKVTFFSVPTTRLHVARTDQPIPSDRDKIKYRPTFQVKQRKAEREVEQQQMEEMRLQIERDAMREQIHGWEQQEEEFHRMQAKRRSEIR